MAHNQHQSSLLLLVKTTHPACPEHLLHGQALWWKPGVHVFDWVHYRRAQGRELANPGPSSSGKCSATSLTVEILILHVSTT